MTRELAKGQIFQLNWVRAIAALMVVCYHTEITLRLPKYFDGGILPVFYPGASGVQLFFVLSGFVIFIAHHRDRHGDWGVMKRFLYKRFRRLYPPLWIVLFVVLAMSLFLPFGVVPTVWDVFASFLILPVERESILAVEWTLRHEIIFYAAFLIFLWSRIGGLLLFAIWGVIGSLVGAFIGGHWLFDFLFNPNHLLFMLGMAVGYFYVRNRMSGGIVALVFGIALFAAAWLIVYERRSYIHEVDDVLFGLGATGIIYGLCALPRLNAPLKVFDVAGAASYSLYLIHYPLISVFAKVAIKFDAMVKLPPVIYFCVIVVVCHLLGVLFHYFVEKPAISLVSGKWFGQAKAPGEAV